MELILNNLDLILTAAAILIAAVVMIRRGQISLLRELLLNLINVTIPQDGDDNEDSENFSERLYSMLPTLTRLLISSGTFDKLLRETNSRL